MANRVVLAVALAGALGSGCASSQAEKVRDARMAEIEAKEREQLASVDARTSSHSDQIERAGEQREQNIEASNTAGADARQELNEVAMERAQYRNEAAGKLDKLSIRLDAAGQKTDVLGDRAPRSLHEELEAARTARQLLEQRVSGLEHVEPARWSDSKAEVERNMDQLRERIEHLNSTIGDV